MSTHTPQSFVRAALAAEREQWTGTPACQHAPSGCNGPRESECIGLCTHRIDASFVPAGAVVAVAGQVEQSKPAPAARARSEFSLYRRFGHSLGASLRHALRALRGAN